MEVQHVLLEDSPIVLRLVPDESAGESTADYGPLAQTLLTIGLERVAIAGEGLPPGLISTLARQGITAAWVDASQVRRYSHAVAVDEDRLPRDAAIQLAWEMVRWAGQGRRALVEVPLRNGAAALPVEEVLEELGPWIKLHGPLLCGADPWGALSEEFCGFSRGPAVWAFFRRMPRDQKLSLTGIKDSSIRDVALIGAGEVQWYQQDSRGLSVHCVRRRSDPFPVAVTVAL